MTPQDKKRASCSKDRRNTYGENAKSSRKNISRNKRIRLRSERRTAREPLKGAPPSLDESRIDLACAKAIRKRRKSWKKQPDTPLGIVVKRKLRRRALEGSVALSFIAVPLICTAAQDKRPDANPIQEPAPPAPAKVADPVAGFARMVGGEWRVTYQSGTSQFDTWHWGPGQHSIRLMTDGSDAVGGPWRALEVVYWHPGRKQVRLLNLHPDVPGIGRGVGEGTFRFEGETAEAVFDLYQTGGRRDIARRWTFDGPDKYRATLLEATGRDRYMPLVEWDYVRSKTLTATRPLTDKAVAKPSERLKALEALLGHTWEVKGNWAAGDAFHTQSAVEWIPLVDAIYVRVLAPSKDGEPTHLLDAYIYHHTGTGALRCLALSNRGGVYEGDLTVLDGGALQIDLQGYEGDQVVPHAVRLDFEKDGTLRDRIWSLKGAERTLMLEARHMKLGPKND